MERIKRSVSIIHYTDDGVHLSDMHLAAVVLSVVAGATCYQAIPAGDASPRFLFVIKGDPNVIRETIDGFYGAKIDGLPEKLKAFVSTIHALKGLIDKAREGTNA